MQRKGYFPNIHRTFIVLALFSVFRLLGTTFKSRGRMTSLELWSNVGVVIPVLMVTLLISIMVRVACAGGGTRSHTHLSPHAHHVRGFSALSHFIF